MKITRIIDIIVKRKVIEDGLRARLDLAKVVVDIPVGRVGPSLTAADGAYISVAIARPSGLTYYSQLCMHER